MKSQVNSVHCTIQQTVSEVVHDTRHSLLKEEWGKMKLNDSGKSKRSVYDYYKYNLKQNEAHSDCVVSTKGANLTLTQQENKYKVLELNSIRSTSSRSLPFFALYK